MKDEWRELTGEPERDLEGEIAAALADPVLQRALQKAMATLYERRSQAWAGDIDFEGLRRRARTIKEDALARNDELLDRLEERVTALGGTVFRAATAQDAREYIVRLAEARGVWRVAKAKSMTAEEIHLNPALERRGIEVVETDLGERIIQLAGERPSHLIVPAIHKTKEQIIELFARTMALADPPTEVEELTRLVRDDLRERFLTADMGVTGANFVVAETGTLVTLENEGNIRLCTQVPPLHVALVGREKIIPRLEDLGPFLELLPRSGTGQRLTSYVSFITGVTQSSLLDFGRASSLRRRELHVVVLDNGRSAAAADPELRETLYCIRCGACLNACAPYRAVGGHVYGADPYPGGIGCAWTFITKGHAEAEEINGLCTTCARCTEVCPCLIDIPWLNTVIRERANEDSGARLRERVFARTDLLGRVGGRLGAVANVASRLPLAPRAASAAGIDVGHGLPSFETQSLERWFAEREPVRLTHPLRRAALFVDCFTNHNLPGVGRATVEVLERAGVQIVLAHNACCGRPSMSQGLLDRPRAWAAQNLAELGSLIGQGHDILCIEPSCLSALRDDYRRLLEATDLADDERLAALEQRTFDVTEYLVLLAREAPTRLRLDPGGEFVVHGHCHQKALGLGSAPAEVLRLIPGATVHEVDALCCGLVGSFGYKTEYSDLSWAIGTRLFEEIARYPGQVVTCGISCRSQLERGTGRPVLHPMEVLRDRLEGTARRPEPETPAPIP